MVVYLQTPVSLQLERTARDRNRPLLRTEDPRKRLTELMELRDPLYRETAHVIMPTSGGSAREVALKIVHALAEREELE
jgi:shikimate kinase